MARHPFDPVSFVLGALALACGALVLSGRSLIDDAHVLLPAGLIGLGVALLLKVGGRAAQSSPSSPAGDDGRHAGPDERADLDRLLAPVDDVQSTWEAEPGRAAPSDETDDRDPTAPSDETDDRDPTAPTDDPDPDPTAPT